MALIIFLLLVCCLWWDQMRQIKRVATECLTDAINAKLIADQKALEAIHRYNQHIEMCNRVIENQESGLATRSGSEDWRREMRDLLTQLATERAKSAKLKADLKNREDIQRKLKGGTNAELVTRLQRAEAELSTRRAQRS